MIDPVSRYFLQNAGRHGPVMLMYHSVVPDGGAADWPWAVTLGRFQSQLDMFAEQGWATPTMAELAASPEKFGDRTVIITFDDGYVDNIHAVEALQARDMRATWFIVSGSVGRTPSWPEDGRPGGRLLNSSELCDMQHAGMEIGSHTVNHVRLTQANDLVLGSEVRESKCALEDILGNEVSSFAYPYGAWDVRCVDAVRDAGYRSACTTRTGWALRDGDPFLLRRLSVFNSDTTSSLARKLYFGSHGVSWSDVSRYFLHRMAVRLKGRSA